MANQVVTVPDYQFSGFYYPEILLALLEYARVNTPELSSELEYETHIQVLRAFALTGHLNNTRVDIVANEHLLDSAELPESVRGLFKLIDYPFQSATPATVECVIKLSRIVDTDVVAYIPQYATVSTEIGGEDEVTYEVQEPLDLNQGDQLSKVFAQEIVRSGIDGSVNTSIPTQFTSATGAFIAGDVGRKLVVWGSVNNNGGEFEILSIVDSQNVTLNGASFVTETGLFWAVMEAAADYTIEANTDSSPFTPWGSYLNGHQLYIAHENIQWGQLSIVLDTAGADFAGVWDYYDPVYGRAYPNLVVDNGSYITFNVNSLLGVVNRGGSFVTITYNLTGQSEQIASEWSTPNNFIDTKGLLGQSVVDTDPLNYTVQVDWLPLENFVDGTTNWQVDGDITYDYPMSATTRWTKRTLEGLEAYWFRYRIVEDIGGTPTVPIIDRIQIDQGAQYFPFRAVQGTTVRNEILGSSNGLADQNFQLAQIPLFDNTLGMEVDETGGGNWEPWVGVANFRNSKASDRHYKLDRDHEGTGKIIFSDGTNGRIPPLGTNNVRSDSYRIGGDLDGNVGANTVTGNDGGISYVEELYNPMPAVGWSVADGVTEASLIRLKEEGPASIRNQERAVHWADAPRVAIDEYRNANGSQVVVRAFAIEEAYGPKTVQLVCVGVGGAFLSQEQLDGIALFFNGDKYSIPPVDPHLLFGYELTAVNYEPRTIDVTAQVIGKGITRQQVENEISIYLNALATNEVGEYIHQFGGRVATVGIDCAIKEITTSITNVHRTVPASDVLLGPKQLPAPGTLAIAVAETE